jgi:hypothetical protein
MERICHAMLQLVSTFGCPECELGKALPEVAQVEIRIA